MNTYNNYPYGPNYTGPTYGANNYQSQRAFYIKGEQSYRLHCLLFFLASRTVIYMKERIIIMTKFEECMLLVEIINIELDASSKRRKVMQFINDNQEEYWLHIDTIREMTDDLYGTIMDEINLVNCAKENNVITNKMNYEDIFKAAKRDMDFITKVKELFSIE